MIFRNRAEAGRKLAILLREYASRSDTVVLALTPGGVPVAFEIAELLGVPLDILLFPKLGTPVLPEEVDSTARGSLNYAVIRAPGDPEPAIDEVARRERLELERRARFCRGDRPPAEVRGRTVILVGDGIETDAAFDAALSQLRREHPARIVIAAPIAAASALRRLRNQVAEVVVLGEVQPLNDVSVWYRDSSSTTDEEIRYLLERAARHELVLA